MGDSPSDLIRSGMAVGAWGIVIGAVLIPVLSAVTQCMLFPFGGVLLPEAAFPPVFTAFGLAVCPFPLPLWILRVFMFA